MTSNANAPAGAAYWLELKQLVRLAIPILLAQLALTGLGVVDTVMSGQVGTDDLAAIGLGSSLLLPVFMISTGVHDFHRCSLGVDADCGSPKRA